MSAFYESADRYRAARKEYLAVYHQICGIDAVFQEIQEQYNAANEGERELIEPVMKECWARGAAIGPEVTEKSDAMRAALIAFNEELEKDDA